MDHEEYCARAEAEISRLAAVVASGPPDLPVPTCPGWSLAALAKHTGIMHRWATALVARRATEEISYRTLDVGLPPNPAGYPGWLAAGAGPLASALRAAGPDATVWTWGESQRSGWWARRMLHETTVHRADAELALGVAADIDPAAAVDGVEEFLDNARLGSRPSQRLGELPGGTTIHLHATDEGLGPDGEWLITLDEGGYRWSPGHAKGTVAVRAPVALLFLLACGRVSPGDGRLQVFGDQSLLASWQAIMTL